MKSSVLIILISCACMLSFSGFSQTNSIGGKPTRSLSTPAIESEMPSAAIGSSTSGTESPIHSTSRVESLTPPISKSGSPTTPGMPTIPAPSPSKPSLQSTDNRSSTGLSKPSMQKKR